MSIYHTTTKAKEDRSAKIARDIKAFKKAGGKIKKIPNGFSAHNLEFKEDERGRLRWIDPKTKQQITITTAQNRIEFGKGEKKQ